ncbi:O-antigen ligase family protein [Bacillus cereus]|uniref:O-antigen ligase family protein n=1 Tax=Bacillus thuringiensis TaxID=1428 RepID=UPI000BEDCA68|nr:O-antigen ligase family protein [Bacillus thuringiensis]MEB9403807.1 O-antigen ligase family protein [Bacillus cereus]MEB9554717.1 O-antigen ligase family protein [Bacillus cereus]PEB88261.1 hypothetical protein COM94_04710 [Bacillus thuringiensis]PFJ61689.1 hypothetical protein COJ02_00150 [Bacillus thuringiensis]
MLVKKLSVISYVILLIASVITSLMIDKLAIMVLPLVLLIVIYMSFNVKNLVYILILFMPCIEILNQYGVGFSIGNFQLMTNSLVSSFFIIIAFLYLFKKNFEIRVYPSLFFTILAYISLGLISTLLATEKIFSIKEEIKLIFYFLLVLIIPFVVNNEFDKKRVIEFFIASSIIPLAVGGLQFLTNSSPIETYLDGRMVIRITGGFTHSNHFAYYISMVGIVLFTQLLSNERASFYKSKMILFIVIGLELFLTYSRTALIMYIFVMIFILFFKKMDKMVFLFPVALMLLILFVNFGSNSSSLIEDRFSGILDIFSSGSYIQDAVNNNYSDSFGWRIYLWSKVLALLVDNNLVFGFGLQNFNFVANQAIGIYIDAHNTFVKVLVEMGIVGFLAFVGFVIQMFVVYFKSKKGNLNLHISSSIYVYFYIILVSFVDPVFSHNVIGFYIWLFVGIQGALLQKKLN